jgi:Tat protein translocase TatB subunit
MFDVGWSEIFMIGAVSVVALGPKELPKIMRTAGRLARRLQYVRFALSQQFEDMMKESGMEDVRKQVNFEEDFDEKAADEEVNKIITTEGTEPTEKNTEESSVISVRSVVKKND